MKYYSNTSLLCLQRILTYQPLIECQTMNVCANWNVFRYLKGHGCLGKENSKWVIYLKCQLIRRLHLQNMSLFF